MSVTVACLWLEVTRNKAFAAAKSSMYVRLDLRSAGSDVV